MNPARKVKGRTLFKIKMEYESKIEFFSLKAVKELIPLSETEDSFVGYYHIYHALAVARLSDMVCVILKLTYDNDHTSFGYVGNHQRLGNFHVFETDRKLTPPIRVRTFEEIIEKGTSRNMILEQMPGDFSYVVDTLITGLLNSPPLYVWSGTITGLTDSSMYRPVIRSLTFLPINEIATKISPYAYIPGSLNFNWDMYGGPVIGQTEIIDLDITDKSAPLPTTALAIGRSTFHYGHINTLSTIVHESMHFRLNHITIKLLSQWQQTSHPYFLLWLKELKEAGKIAPEIYATTLEITLGNQKGSNKMISATSEALCYLEEFIFAYPAVDLNNDDHNGTLMSLWSFASHITSVKDNFDCVLKRRLWRFKKALDKPHQQRMMNYMENPTSPPMDFKPLLKCLRRSTEKACCAK
jgi:hypothetical protein